MRSATDGRQSRAGGFTLLELLVAMAIFAVIGAMALGGLNAVLGQGSLATGEMERLARLQRAMRLITTDLAALQPRFVRDELGDAGELPLVTTSSGEFLVRLTRGGWSNPANSPFRGTLQRVQYRLKDGVLIREYWAVLDRVLGDQPRSEELLTGVEKVQIEYLDRGSDWSLLWPPVARQTPGNGERPRAIRVTLELEGWGKLERLVEVVQ